MKIVYYALSVSAALVVVVICFNIACITINNTVKPNTSTKTEVVDLDKTYRVSNAKFKGHDYLLFESGERGEVGYAIFLEHKADCKVCCEQFD